MAEISCPNCQAKYDVPVAALGAEGREVACANCGHKWHAKPPAEEPLILSEALRAPAPSPAPDPAPAPATPVQSAPQPASPPPVPPAPPQAAPAASGQAEPPVSAQAAAERIREDRARQLAEIRQIVDEVQNAPTPGAAEAPATPPAEPSALGAMAGGLAASLGVGRAEPAPAPTPPSPPPVEAPPAPAAAAPAVPVMPAYRSQPAEPARDPLREKIDPKGKTPPDTDKTRKNMMRKHSRRARRRVARDKRGSGLFLTGFLLVIIVAAVLAAVYVLGDQIVAFSPGLEPAIAEYKARVDEIRVAVAANVSAVSDWVTALISDPE
ncbi:MAG: zinc-ribbon domain-containing protein [Pseudomonadota bacterium]